MNIPLIAALGAGPGGSGRWFRMARLLGAAAICAGLAALAPGFCRAGVNEPAGAPPPPSRISPQADGAKVMPVPVPEASEQALRHHHTSMVLLGVATVWNLVVVALFLFTGASARLRSWAERLGRRWYATFALYSLVLAAGYYLVNLPLAYYAGFVHPHHYGLSNQTFGKWFGNTLKRETILMVMALAVGWVPFRLVRSSPRRWWLYLGLLAVPYICLMCLIQPVVIDPLFNQFRPMRDQALESKILSLAAQAGIQGSRVYQVDKSVDTKAVNAYVTGFMGSKRIVIWDTALRALDEEELLFIMGHEMGHYVLGHIARSIALSSVLVLLLLLTLHLLAGRAIDRFKATFGFSAMSDIAAAPLGILILQLLVIAGMPLPMAFSRHQEHEADRFGLELTRNNHAAAMAFVKLQQSNLSVPRPSLVQQIWLGSHPCLADRIEFCNTYRPWESGQPLKYGK